MGTLRETSPRLRRLSIQNSNIVKLDLSGSAVEDLEIVDSTVKDLVFPKNLVRLTLSNHTTERLRIPKTVRALRLNQVQWKELPELPRNLEELDIGDCTGFLKLPLLPPTLRVLRLPRTRISPLGVVPQRLEELDVLDSRIKAAELQDLPSTLRLLAVDPQVYGEIRRLPSSLRDLRFSPPPDEPAVSSR